MMINYKEIEDQYSLEAMPRRPISIVKGKGAIVWDDEGNEYIDCVAGIAVAVLGHCHKNLVNTVKNQSNVLITSPAFFYNPQRALLLEKLCKLTGMNKGFLGNSGTESIEAAIKFARLHTKKLKLICFKGAFHGRTMGSLGLTPSKCSIQPEIPGIVQIPYNNLDAVKSNLDDNVAAIVVEPIQGEAGIKIPDEGYLHSLDEICKGNGSLLIIDEVQTGMGRTGSFLASQGENIKPDIICLAKGLAGGLPGSVTLVKEDIAKSVKSGQHGSTFGGNPLVASAGLATLRTIEEENLVEKARTNGKFFLDLIEDLSDSRIVRDVRGRGLMIGIELKTRVTPIVKKAMEKGLLLHFSGKTIIRILPPLTITKSQLSTVAEILGEIL